MPGRPFSYFRAQGESLKAVRAIEQGRISSLTEVFGAQAEGARITTPIFISVPNDSEGTPKFTPPDAVRLIRLPQATS